MNGCTGACGFPLRPDDEGKNRQVSPHAEERGPGLRVADLEESGAARAAMATKAALADPGTRLVRRIAGTVVIAVAAVATPRKGRNGHYLGTENREGLCASTARTAR